MNIGLLAIMLTACSGASSSPSPAATMPVPSRPSNELNLSANLLESAMASPETKSTKLEASPLLQKKELEPPKRMEATMLAIGDIMVHMPQYAGYYDEKKKLYDFSPWFSQVKPILSQGDWVVGNLETPIAGKDLKYSGYPRFNAPAELLKALSDIGIGIVTTANNHAMDRGFPGVQRTLRNVRAAGLIPVGTSESATDHKRLVIVEKNGIRMGFLAYSYGTNGIPIPPDKSYAVNLIDVPTIREDISKLRKAGVDAITVSLHFGIEYQRLPNAVQIDIVHELIKAGADIVLGSHPHVLQPYDVIHITASESFDGQARQGLVIYSLGNFISNQSGNWKDVGLIFSIRLVKTLQADGTSVTQWDNVGIEPTWVHIRWMNKKRYFTVIPLQRELASRSLAELTAAEYEKMTTMLGGIKEHLLKLQPN
jgi:poly-gamma-glutamate capsule biosynthesis protein CapA/YwtB (metallophosphatase superfamily)